MLLRLLPFFLCFGAGFAVCLILLARSRPPGAARDWETKYREVSQRYRDLSERLKSIDRDADLRATSLRQALAAVRDILAETTPAAADAAHRALEAIDAALRKS